MTIKEKVMAKTASNMLELGSKAPTFALEEPATGNIQKLDSLADKPVLVVAFICNHCPYVVHIIEAMTCRFNAWVAKGVAVVAINSNDVEKYPEDAPDKMQAFAKNHGFEFPYLFDPTQEVAKSYQAACTPDFYVFNDKRQLVYRGQFDASRPGNDVEVTGEDLNNAVVATLENKTVDLDQKPSIGCNIKWLPGS